MALADILDLAHSQQEELHGFERALENELQDSYRSVLSRLDDDIGRLTDKIARAQANGEKVSESWLFAQDRYRSLQRQVVSELEGFGEYVEDRVTAMQGAAVSLAEDYSHDLMRAGGVPPRHNFAGLPKRAVQDIVGRAAHDGSLLSKALAKYPQEAAAAIRKQLVVGVALGHSPKKIAGELRGKLGGAVGDYLTVARTEVLGAHRNASLQTLRENTDVVSEWEWLMGRSDACPYCQGQNKKRFPLSEPFVSHPSCRCALLPVLKVG